MHRGDFLKAVSRASAESSFKLRWSNKIDPVMSVVNRHMCFFIILCKTQYVVFYLSIFFFLSIHLDHPKGGFFTCDIPRNQIEHEQALRDVPKRVI